MRRTHPLEIIVVLIGIIILGAGLLLPMVERARDYPHPPRCLSNVKQLGLALKQYSQDFNDRYPWHVGAEKPNEAWRDLGLLFPNYSSSFKTFFCPSSKDRPYALTKDPFDPLPFSSSREVISYAYGIDARDPSGRRSWDENALSTVRLLADKKAGTGITAQSNHKRDGRNVLYQDGHVKWKAGDNPLDPDEDDNAIGSPTAADYKDWWSDPPYYGEKP